MGAALVAVVAGTAMVLFVLNEETRTPEVGQPDYSELSGFSLTCSSLKGDFSCCQCQGTIWFLRGETEI